MPGSRDKEEKRNASRLHHTIPAWRLLDACLTNTLRFLYAAKNMLDMEGAGPLQAQRGLMA